MYYGDWSRLRLFLEKFEESFLVRPSALTRRCASDSSSTEAALRRFFFFFSLHTRGVSSGVEKIDFSCIGDEALSPTGLEPETSSSFALCFFSL